MPRPIATRSCPPPLGSPLAGRPLVPLLGLALLLLTASCGEETAAVKKTADDGRVDTRGKELVLSSVRPAVVPATGNVAVVGMGAGFLEGLTVSVAGQTVSDVELLDRYGTMLLFTVPAGVEGQKVDVVVTNPSGAMAKLTAAITYGPPLPPRDPQQDPLELSSLQPDNAPADGGALLVAGGAGFGGTLSVSLGGVQAEDVRVLDSAGTLLSFPAPPGREGQSVDLVVQRNGRESATLTGALTYGARQARIAPADEPLLLRSLEPAEVPADGGTLVVARGSGFVLEMTLTVGGIAVASPTVLDETGTVLTFLAPPGNEGDSMDVVLRRADRQQAALPGGLRYGPPLQEGGDGASLQLHSVLPSHGPETGGSEVVVNGQGFREGSTVGFRGQPGEVRLFVSSRTLLVVTPPGAPGAADVTVANPSGRTATLEGAFSYEEVVLPPLPGPQIFQVLPGEGLAAGGEEVVVSGGGFDPETTLFFGIVAAEITGRQGGSVISARTPPAAGAPGPVDVVVRNADGQEGVLAEGFTYLPDPRPAELALLRAVPLRGATAGSEPVTLFGQGFTPEAEVFFGQIPVLGVELVSTELLVVRTPPSPPGAAVISAQLSGGRRVVLPSSFWFDETLILPGESLLTLSSVLPERGSVGGGTRVALVGSGFTARLQATFAGTAATAVEVVSSTVALATCPPGEPGRVAVAVFQPGDEPVSLPGAFTYLDDRPPALRLRSVWPAEGPFTGGTEVVLVGQGFAPGQTVLFGAAAATELRIESGEVARAATPPGPVGAVTVTVRSAQGLETSLPRAFVYRDERRRLAAASLAPGEGPAAGGTEVIVAGAGFVPGLVVRFGLLAAAEVEVLGDEAAMVVTPASTPGPVDVTLELPGEQPAILPGAFTFVDDEPVEQPLARCTPSLGPTTGGTVVTLTGSGFAAGSSVLFGNSPASGVTVLGDASIVATTPPGPVGPAEVRVTRPGLEPLLLDNLFYYFDPAAPWTFPTLLQASPHLGPAGGGTILTLRGTGFDAAATIYVGRQPAQVWSRWGDTIINVRTPPAPPGSADITVVNPGGRSATLVAGFTYYPDDGQGVVPTLATVVPAAGPTTGGIEIIVTGTGLQDGLTLLVGPVPAEVRRLTGRTTIVALLGAGTLGPARLAVTNPDGRSAILENAFTFVQPPPELLQVVPAKGPAGGGTGVVLYGRELTSGTQVFFGATLAPEIVVHSSNAIGVTTPPGNDGPVAVRVVARDGQSSTLADGFTYVSQGFPDPPPVLRALRPDRGPFGGGTITELDGTGFAAGIRVLFGGVPAARVKVVGPTRLVVVTPPAGSPRTVEVAVLNPDGQGSSRLDGFHYVTPAGLAPRLYGVTPAAGPELGGASVMLTGGGLQQGGQAFVGYAPVANLVRLNDAIATFVTPAGAPGAADVSWTNPDGQSATLARGYTYAAVPVLDAIEPVVGPVAGSTFVTLAGSSFQAGASVTFAGRPATEVQVFSTFVITCRTPPGTEGSASVVVRNPDGQLATLPDGFTYLLPPELASARPARLLSTGGTPVVVRGKHLAPGVTLALDGAVVPAARRVSGEVVTLVAPPGAIGKKPTLRVTNPDGQGAVLIAALQYVGPAGLGDPPAILEVRPDRGPAGGGTYGFLRGTGFAEGSFVLFGGWPIDEETMVDEGLILFVSPAVEELGSVDVTVVNPDGQFAIVEDGFAFVDPAALGPAPEVTALDPAAGPTAGGTRVHIRGTALLDGAVAILGDRPMDDLALFDIDVLRGTSPPGETGPARLVVTNPDGQSVVEPDMFLFVPPPAIEGVLPVTGPSVGSTSMTITGRHFTVGDAPAKRSKVLFCDDWAAQVNCEPAPAALIDVVSPGEIRLITPQHTPGFVQLVVVNPDGQHDVLDRAYQYTPPPAIDAVTPAHGSTRGGERITITGQGFLAGATVTIGRDPCREVVVQNQSTAVCTTPPAETAGPVAVAVRNVNGGIATLGGGFLYIHPPDITAVYPTNGPEQGGTMVTLEGRFFAPGPPEKARVYFGLTEVPPADVDVLSPTIIRAISPPGIGLVSVRVVNPDGQSDLVAGVYTYTPPIPPPVLAYIAPDYGMSDGGLLVNVVGQRFLAGARVFFGKDPRWVEGFDPQVRNNGTLVLVTLPAHSPGVVDVKLRNTDGQEVVLADGFEYVEPLGLPALAFISMMPERSPLAGGIVTVITGRGFKYGIRVFVGDAAASRWVEALEVLRLGPTALRVAMPPAPGGQGGLYDIMLQNPSEGEPDRIVQADVFRYTQGAVFLLKGHRLPIDERYDHGAVMVDANGDGLQDVLVLRNGPDELHINTPQGAEPAGWFVDQTAALLPNAPSCLSLYPTVADFDSDGDQDVLIWCTNNYLYLYRNAGDGRFSVEQKSPAVDGVTDVEVGDLNCDSHPDLLISRDNRANIVRIGNGKGEFWDAPAGVFPTVAEPSRGVAIGDVDNDGDPDLLVANDSAYQNKLYYNNCNNVPMPPACSRDVDGCTMREYNGHRYAFCAIGRNWQDAQTHCWLFGLDLATVNDAAENTWIRQYANGWWVGYSDAKVEGTWTWPFGASQHTNWCGGQPNGGDGADCAFVSGNANGCFDDDNCAGGRYYVCESAAPACPQPWRFVDGQYGDGKNFPVSGGKTRDARLFDVNGDGFLDAILINNEQNNWIYINNGGSFNNDLGLRYPQDEANKLSYAAHLVDVDRDGDLDMFVIKLVATGPDRFWPDLYLNDRNNGGSGAFIPVSAANLPPWFGEDTYGFAFGDLSGDLLPDIYVVNYNLQDRLLINNGYRPNEPQIPQNRVPIGVYVDNTIVGYPSDNDDTRSVEAGDIDGDGDPDLIVCSYLKRVGVLLNDGLGNFFDRTTTRLPSLTTKERCTEVRLLDIDDDGDLDLIVGTWHDPWGSGSNGQKYQLVNDGHGVFSRNSTSANMPQYSGYCGSIDAGDIDRDGDLDLVFAGYDPWGNPDLKLFTNGGDPFNVGGAYFFDQTASWFSGRVTPPGATRAVRMLDLNNDGYLDLYIGRYGQQNLLYHYVIADRTFREVTVSHLPAVNDNTYDIEVFDFDQDGDNDLFVTNNGLNRLHVGEKDWKFSDVTSINLPQISLDSRASAVGDVDEDTLLDVIVVNWDTKHSLYMNAGGGAMTDGSASLPWSKDYSWDVAMADFDGDGDLDYFVANQGQNRIYLNQNHQP